MYYIHYAGEAYARAAEENEEIIEFVNPILHREERRRLATVRERVLLIECKMAINIIDSGTR
jgi:hypothetical protein